MRSAKPGRGAIKQNGSNHKRYKNHFCISPSKNDNADLANLNGCQAVGTYNSFMLTISGSQLTTKDVLALLSPTADNSLLKMIGTYENYITSSLFFYLHFANYYSGSVTPSGDATIAFNTSTITFTSSYAEGYDAASTP